MNVQTPNNRHRRFAGAIAVIAATVATVATVASVVLLSGCGTDSHDSTASDPATVADPSAPPTGVTWQRYQGVELPRTDQGPAQENNGAATGFTQNPPGAAIAAINHHIRLTAAPDDQWAAVTAATVAPGPARDDWATNRVQLSTSRTTDSTEAARLRGYRIGDYRPDHANVDVYLTFPDNSTAVFHTTVVWLGGDWRLQLPDPAATTRSVDTVEEIPADIVQLEPR